MIIKAKPITAAAFKPFGGITRHAKDQPLAVVSDAFAHHPDATIPALEWVMPAAHMSLPTHVTRVERHPFSAQTFLPHKDSTFLVVVCSSEPDGSPDIATTKAFIVGSETGVTFARNIWHRSLAPLESGSGYTMAMMRTGRDDDTVFHDLSTTVEVVQG